jgi:hypothetical protein
LGRYDSSLTRVQPLFDQLRSRDPPGESWINELLALPRFGSGHEARNRSHRLLSRRAGTTYAWGEFERALDPPLPPLRWLVRNLADPENELALDRGRTLQNREALIRRDPGVIAQALELLEREPHALARYVLEDPSQPDFYHETEQSIIVIEGKRTEPGPTTRKTWMPCRHHMLRHIDCAWEIRDSRDVFGFLIVEATSSCTVPPEWAQNALQTISNKALEDSLPHRRPSEHEAIWRRFLGVTTCQAVCLEFDLEWSTLPKETLG